MLIDPTSGLIVFTSSPDYESTNAYSALITVSDGTNTSSQLITVNINNLNDNNPVITSNNSFTADENQTAIGTVTATDADGDAITFNIIGSDILINSSGVLTFSSAPDYETKPSYSATVTATDGTNSVEQTINITVSNINEAPSFTSNATFTADENQTAIGTVTATDPEGDSITFTISGNELSITSAGVLTFSSAPDYETNASYTATVTATDGTNSTTQNITVSVNNVNDNSPSFTSNATFTADENQTAIGTVTATDADGDDVTFTVSGSELAITSAGVLTFSSAPDYETNASYTATVTATDGTNSTTQNITVSVNNLNDNNPVITSASSFTVDENQTAIGTVTATDADGDDVTFTVSGSELAITSAGVLTFSSAPDHETKTSYSATITVSDGANSTTQNITVNVNNVNDNSPSFTSNATFTADENQTAIGTVTATDADGDDVTFTVSGSELAITSAGVLTFVSAPDHETKTSYSATITVSDGANSTTQNITVNVNNLNDNSPSFTSNATFTADENQTAIGTVTATDADGDGIVFSISGSEITINASSGVLAFSSAPDYETKTSYTATVTASDGTNSTTQNITVSVNNLNDNSPNMAYIPLNNTVKIIEGHKKRIWPLRGSDSDNDDLNITLSGSDASLFEIDNDSDYYKTLKLINDSDYENKSEYNLTVNYSDGINSSTQDLIISVIDGPERIGDIIKGTDNFHRYGAQTAVSGDGKTIAVYSGGPVNGDSSRNIKIYNLSNNNWSLIGTIDYNFLSNLGISSYPSWDDIDLNHDGTIISFRTSAGVHIFEYTNSQWVQKGSTLALSNSSLDMHKSGLTIIAGDNAGLAIYDFIESIDGSSDWVQRGSNIPQSASNAVISPNANIVAVYVYTTPTIANCGTHTTARGVVYIYEWSSNSWSLKDEITACDITNFPSDATISSGDWNTLQVDNFGYSMNFTSAGNYLLIGSESYYTPSSNNQTVENGVYIIYNISSKSVYGNAFWPEKTCIADGLEITSNCTQYTSYNSGHVALIDWGNTIGESGEPTIHIDSIYEDHYSTDNGQNYWSNLNQGLTNWSYYDDTNQRGPNSIREYKYESNSWIKGNNNIFPDKFSIKEDSPYSNGYGKSVSLSADGSTLVAGFAGDRKREFDTWPDHTGYVDVRELKNSNIPSSKILLNINNSITINENLSRGGNDVSEKGTASFTVSSDVADYRCLLSGRDADFFTLNSSSQCTSISFASNVDYENHSYPNGDSKYIVKLMVTDGVYWDAKFLNITIGDVNDAPYFTSTTNPFVDENQNNIITLTANDEDGDSVTFGITARGGDDVNYISLNSSTGAMTFINSHNPDYETKSEYLATITVTDGSLTYTEDAFRVNINDLNEPPTITSSDTFNYDENSTAPIGTITVSDPDINSTTFNHAITYSIDGDEITIDSNGELNFVDVPNYEIKSSYTATVTVSDGTNSVNQTIIVSINDVAESPPTFTSNSTFNINENETAIGTVSATSSGGSAIIYSVSGTDASAININSSSGELTFVSAPDYETKNLYSAVIKAVETTGGSATQSITINIQNLLEFTDSGSINGSNVNSYFGENNAIDINPNGDVIAIGERYQAGRVHVYKNNSGWTQLGSPIDGEEYDPNDPVTGSDNAYTLSLSGDGMRIAIGASRNDGASNTIANSGHVRVYEYFNNSWSQLGSDIDGTGTDDAFGTDIDISGDGNRLIVWVPNDDDNGSNSGSAIVYEFLNGSWSQIGSIISGISAGDGASGRGGSVSISTDGSKILVGIAAGQGYVRAYEWSSNNWTQMGSNITGSSSDCLGTDVQFSGDGNSIIAGSYCSNSNNGAIKIYSYTNNNWSQKGNTINGASSDFLGQWGSKIDISHDGNRIAFGTNNNDGLFQFYEYQNNSWSQVGILSPSSGNKINGLQVNAEMTSVIYADYRYNSNRGRVSMMDIDFVPSTTAPSITTTSMNINEESGSGLVDSIQTSDSENDSLTYHVGGIDGNLFSINSSNGYLSFNDAWIDYESPQDNDSDNYYKIRAYVTDGILWSSKEISVRVIDEVGTQAFGADIVGTTNFQGLNATIALSDDGKRLVIGYPYDSGGGTRRGSVKVFENTSNNTWTQIGSTITGSSNEERLGSSVDISGDGNRIIIGANASDISQAMQVRMYYWATNEWARMLTDYLNPPNSNYTQWGYDVAIDDDGDRIAIISASANTDWQNDNAGAVRVYQIGSTSSSPTDLVVNYNGSARQFMEGSSNGYEDNANQRFYSVDMNNDGTALMVSLISNSTNLGPGGYRVFTNGGTSLQQGSTWTHRTDDNNTRQYETCSQNGKSAGYHAAMTGDTIASNLANARIVCGSPGDPNPSYTGDNYHVEIDKWNENYNNSFDWENIHAVTTGNNNDRRGERVAISDNGNYVLYSAPMSDDGSTDAGQIKLLYGTSSYSLQASTSTINGSENGESCGSNIAISGSGRIIAMHCEGYDGSSGNAVGRTRIFINK